MKRLQSEEWKMYQRQHPKARILKIVYSTNNNTCIYGKGWYHWCDDIEKVKVFYFIRNNKHLFEKRGYNNRVFYVIDPNSYTINIIKGVKY